MMRELDALEQLGRLARKTDPPAMDVADAVLARLSSRSRTSANRRLAMVASLSTIVAVVALAVVLPTSKLDDSQSDVILSDLERQMLAPIDLLGIANK